MKLNPSCAVVLTLFLLAGCNQSRPGVQSSPPSVTVSLPVREQVLDSIDLTGTVAPSRTVDLVARVTGYLQSVNFQEGSFVEAGQLLFVIEPESYQQQLKAAEATLLRATSEYDRQLELMKSEATSKSSEEKWRSDRDQAAAQVELAKLNLSYTRVTAPFAGRMGRRLVDPGNLVGPTANTKLATLDQLIPIYVYFSLNERDALRAREANRRRGYEPQLQMGRIPVWVGLQNEEGFPHEGVIEFIDTGVDQSSGTILLRATFKNEGWTFFPGLFVRVRLPLGQPGPMLVVPNSALGNDQEGDYVLVVGAGEVVARRAVVKGPLTPTGRALHSGVTAEDRVIVSGQLKARPGTKVTPVNAAPAALQAPKPAAPTPTEITPPGRSPVRGPTNNPPATSHPG